MQKKSEECMGGDGMPMEISFEGGAGHRYMQIPATQEHSRHYAMRMLMENRIEGLLRMQMQTVDNETVFSYDITGCFSVREYCEDKETGYTLVDSLYTWILKAVEQGREYLLPDSGYLLVPDTIYLRECTDGGWNVETGYHIGQYAGVVSQLAALTEFLMEHVNHKDKKAVKLVYGIYGLLREEGVSISRIKEHMDTCREVPSEISKPHILPRQLQVLEEQSQNEFVQDLEKIKADNKWNAAITVASALGMAAFIAILAHYGNLPFRSLLILAAGAVVAELVICALFLKE